MEPHDYDGLIGESLAEIRGSLEPTERFWESESGTSQSVHALAENDDERDTTREL